MSPRTFAIIAVAVMLIASCSASMAVDADREEPDGFPPLVVALLAAGSFAAGWFANDYFESDDQGSQEYLRLASANNITDVMKVASVFVSNSNANYAQIWGMTKEHWIRQAELEAYSEWGHGKSYDSNSILIGSEILANNAIMNANAVAQIGSLFDELMEERISAWSGSDTYSGKMSAGFVLDDLRVMSDSELDAKMMSYIEGSGRVFIGKVDDRYVMSSDAYAPGFIYNQGPATAITDSDGLSYTVPHGLTYLDDIYSEEGHRRLADGVYTVTNVRLGGDTLAAVPGSGLSLKASLLMGNGPTEGMAVLSGDKILFGNGQYDGLFFRCEAQSIPDGESQPDAVDQRPVLESYQRLLDKLFWTTVSANNAASAVWSVYAQADARDHNVTTLMGSNVYETAVLSDAMNEVMTLSAMQQLASYYDIRAEDLEDLEIGLYASGMDAPFVRGTVLDRYGNTVYGDVIMTLFFQTKDVALHRGDSYMVDQSTLLAVWHDGMELNSWYGSGMSASDMRTTFLEEGCTIIVTQLAQCDSQGMHSKDSIEFKVTKVRYIEPGRADLSKDIDFQSTAKNVLQLLCLMAGALLFVLGLLRTDYTSLAVGIVLILFAVLFADPVWGWLSDIRGTLPW